MKIPFQKFARVLKLRTICRLTVLLASVWGLQVEAQSYSVGWYKISGGGGTSTNGQFSIAGTIGQHDASTAMTSGQYSATGGFWTLAVVQIAEAPTLHIQTTTTNTVTVFWSSTVPGWNLQVSPTMAPGSWVAPGETIQSDGTNSLIIINPPTGNRFYRLQKP